MSLGENILWILKNKYKIEEINSTYISFKKMKKMEKKHIFTIF